jgi:hypothetical protein
VTYAYAHNACASLVVICTGMAVVWAKKTEASGDGLLPNVLMVVRSREECRAEDAWRSAPTYVEGQEAWPSRPADGEEAAGAMHACMYSLLEYSAARPVALYSTMPSPERTANQAASLLAYALGHRPRA